MLYAWSTILDAAREFCGALFYKFELAILVCPICLLSLNVFVQFSAMIMNHVYRLRHVGKVCSGDYLTSEEKANYTGLEYMISRGKFLWALLIIYWVVIGLVCCGCCVAIAAAASLLKK